MFWIMVLGIATGMRCMTPMAVLCWFMWFAAMPVTRLNFWTANFVAVLVFTVFAFGEYYGDTLAGTPSRKSFLPLTARLVFGVLAGVLLDSSWMEPLAGGVILGVVGVLIGTFGGYRLRMYFAGRVGRDFPVAVSESALALALSGVAMWRISADMAMQNESLVRKVLQQVSKLAS